MQLGLNETDPLLTNLQQSLEKGYRIFLFSGDVGSGKTTLIKFWARALGVTSPIQSPTYGIVHQYNSSKGIINHSDWYRVQDISELYDLGIHEDMEDNLWFIEWPEMGLRLAKSFHHVHVHIQAPETLQDTTRTYTVEYHN